MIELYRHIGEDTDIPAGDIGVGAREISFLFGQYKRLANRFTGILTGKGLAFGGSLVRTEATGFGCVYFMENMLGARGDSPEGKTAVVSGSGNVALYTIEKLNQLGAKVLTASDSGGFIHDPDGIGGEKLEYLKDLKEVRRGRISEYAEKFGCTYHEGERPWNVPCDLAFPCHPERNQRRGGQGTYRQRRHGHCRGGQHADRTRRCACLHEREGNLRAEQGLERRRGRRLGS